MSNDELGLFTDKYIQEPLLITLILISAWMSINNLYKVWGDITYPFPNFDEMHK